jgi:exopolysaccharide production protein ExoY
VLYLRGVEAAKAEDLRFTLPGVLSTAFSWRLLYVCERLVALLCLAAALPLIFVAGVAIAILSRRSPLVAHQRVGLRGKSIWVLKLRTMWPNRSGAGGVFIERLCETSIEIPARKEFSDPRITSRFARFCRRYSIDELPQLWHVAQGEMALVGPRPLTRSELEVYYGHDTVTLLSQNPGLTGLWQVHGRSRLSYRQRRRLDLFMIRRWSVPLYFRILIATLPKLFTGKDAW